MDRFINTSLRYECLAGFPVIVASPVAWGDMDYFRHVNNIVFFRYFESARIAYLERVGFDKEQEESGIGPILAATPCRFRKPLTYPDVVHIGARTVALGADRFEMEYRLVSEALGAVAAKGAAPWWHSTTGGARRRGCRAPSEPSSKHSSAVRSAEGREARSERVCTALRDFAIRRSRYYRWA